MKFPTNAKCQVNISQIMPVRPKNIRSWDVNMYKCPHGTKSVACRIFFIWS